MVCFTPSHAPEKPPKAGPPVSPPLSASWIWRPKAHNNLEREEEELTPAWVLCVSPNPRLLLLNLTWRRIKLLLSTSVAYLSYKPLWPNQTNSIRCVIFMVCWGQTSCNYHNTEATGLMFKKSGSAITSWMHRSKSLKTLSCISVHESKIINGILCDTNYAIWFCFV